MGGGPGRRCAALHELMSLADRVSSQCAHVCSSCVWCVPWGVPVCVHVQGACSYLCCVLRVCAYLYGCARICSTRSPRDCVCVCVSGPTAAALKPAKRPGANSACQGQVTRQHWPGPVLSRQAKGAVAASPPAITAPSLPAPHPDPASRPLRLPLAFRIQLFIKTYPSWDQAHRQPSTAV